MLACPSNGSSALSETTALSECCWEYCWQRRLAERACLRAGDARPLHHLRRGHRWRRCAARPEDSGAQEEGGVLLLSAATAGPKEQREDWDCSDAAAAGCWVAVYTREDVRRVMTVAGAVSETARHCERWQGAVDISTSMSACCLLTCLLLWLAGASLLAAPHTATLPAVAQHIEGVHEDRLSTGI